MQCKSICDMKSGLDPLPFKWQDLLVVKNGLSAFWTGANIHFNQKSILELGAL